MNNPNPELQLADDFVRDTDCNVFLTGKAGTGKTTFLHNLKKNTHKRMIVTAPTGVAAINAGGVTLHSFFQMPFGPFVPGSEAFGYHDQRKFNKEKINIIKSLDLLVIDEISMVRADLLDGVDMVLRRYRRSDLPFGGVQLLMIGDLQQLSPVVKEAEWQILRDYYESIYFFSSNALRQTELLSIELKHIYRQSDPHFIELLNRVRDNELDTGSLQKLNSRFMPNFVPADDEGYITLGTHNRSVDAINESRLQALPAKKHCFNADVEGDFPEYAHPTSAILELKVGAQVMFVRNDSSRDKLYFNGKIGKITRFANKAVFVKCPGDKEEIRVEPATWENIKYTIDNQTKEIIENKIGKFVQYPLKSAWAITIHKSQGLTFDKAVIDAASSFAHGQVYVALSRCRTFEGMVLSSPLSLHSVKSDATVLDFVKQACSNPPSQERLIAEKINHQQRLLADCFEFGQLRFRLNRLLRVLLSNAQVVTVAGVDDIRELENRGIREIFVVSENFKRQLSSLFAHGNLPQTDPVILERISKASSYFQEKIEAILGESLRALRVDSDNKEINKRVKNALNELNKEIAVKTAAVKCCETGFAPERYLRALSAADIDFKPDKIAKAEQAEYTAADVAHPVLFQTMKDWRAQLAAKEGLPQYRILHQSVLIQIAVNLPDNPADMKKIKGIGPRTLEKYGKELVDMVAAYRQQHRITEVVLPELKAAKEEVAAKKEKPADSNTRQASFDLFQKGLTVTQIAEERSLVTSTIQGHLTHFVENGELEIGRLLSPEKQHAISQKLVEMKNSPHKEIKIALGDDYSYGDIKLVLAHLKYLEGKSPEQI
ncbi:MAG: helix-turn-helix domain-containing protein [Proteobacteria bacterium]|nr:helix-turn-helix domain-containing protein [Pseudomonadota bacterium]MBU4296170.1 helix-turn-helix domain-containing protein [Pseudomonadota bacterium]